MQKKKKCKEKKNSPTKETSLIRYELINYLLLLIFFISWFMIH